MRQGQDYLNHTWDPHSGAKRFEYSTSPIYLAAALTVCINEISLYLGVEYIRDRIFQLQDLFIQQLDSDRCEPLLHEVNHRSGILSLLIDESESVVQNLLKSRIVCTSRGGLLRLSPHCYNTDQEMHQTAEVLNALLKKR